MKILLLIMVISISFIGMGFSQSVTITSPNGGENWVLGSSHQITWTSSGVTGNVKLILFQNGTKLGNIVLNLPVTQSSYTWSVGSHTNGVATPGTGFSVKIRAANGGYSDLSNNHFDISTNIPSASLVVNKPNGGEQWVKNSTKNISWTASGISGTIKLMLFKNGVKLGNIAVNLPMSPSTYSWKVGVHSNGVASLGTGYMIKVRSGNYEDLSNNSFRIKSKILPPGMLKIVPIKIIKPSSRSFWKEGTKHDIVWKNTHTKNKKLKIDLYSYDGKEFISNIYTKNYLYTNPNSTTSKYSWTVPDIGPKKCKIKISVIDGIGKGTSDMFTLTIQTKIKKYKIFGTTYNSVKLRKSESYSNTDPVYYETPTAGNPGPGKMRFGSESFHNKTSDSSYLYRSYVWFDVSQLKGKGVILKAKLYYTVYKTTGNCGISRGNVHIVDEAWGGSKMFTCSLTNIYQSTNLAPFVTKWVANSESNFGFAILAKEAKHYMIWGQDTKCYSLAKDVYLEIDILEKQ